LLAFHAISTYGQSGDAAPSTPIYLDLQQPLDKRVADLVTRMTPEEKASQLHNAAAAIPRLRVPAYYWWNEGLHGVGFAYDVTSFPQAIGVAAAFDQSLVQRMSDAIATEMRARYGEAVRSGLVSPWYGLTVWSPNVNIFRDPRWGRGQETYGEDPYLTGRLGVAYVRGLQGDDPHYLKAIATPKHFAVHSGPESTRHVINVAVSQHDLADTYLPAFRATAVEGHAESLMCAYNRVNGEPACANQALLGGFLRGAWKFDGYVVSDCGVLDDIWKGHKFAADLPSAIAVAMRHGLDLDCDLGQDDSGAILKAMQAGLASEAVVDTALQRLFRARFRLGMFDPPEATRSLEVPISAVNSPEHQRLALELARASMVLLKNNGVLPLAGTVHRIAVVGPLADSERALLGNYFGTPPHPVTVLDGLRRQFPKAQIRFAPGTDFARTPFLIPASALATDGKQGLTATFFDNKTLAGPPVATRTDTQLGYGGFGLRMPPEQLYGKDYSVRWTGMLTPQATGAYTLVITGGGGARVWVDGRLLLDDWKDRPTDALAPAEQSGNEKAADVWVFRERKVGVTLTAGRPYELKVEHFQSAAQYPDDRWVTTLLSRFDLGWVPHGGEDVASALAAAREADIVVATVGITAELESEENPAIKLTGFNGGDRTRIELPQPEQDVLEAVKSAHKPLVVVLMSGSALAIDWAAHNADAIIQAWYPGQSGGTAIAETLAGLNNPAGRLPVTFYRSTDDLPPFDDYSMKNRTYRYFKGPVLYPFGYGLSYSRFSYGNARLSSSHLKAGETLQVDVDLQNVAGPAGDDVAQLYVTFPELPGAPLRALRAFQRLKVPSGATRHVHFELAPRDLSYVDESGHRTVASGDYEIFVGGGQPHTDAPGESVRFAIDGVMNLPE
jgi:beta-glucosidase